MNAAEYRTLREACGLSQQAAADFHAVSSQTIWHWEIARNGIPDHAADELRRLNAAIERAVTEQLTLYRKLLAEHGPADAVVLRRYRSAEEYAASRHGGDGLPWSCHCALVARAMLALERAGATVTVAWGMNGLDEAE